MSDQASKDAAAKERIVNHMNEDHRDSVIRYLEFYHKIPGHVAYDGKVADVSLSQLTFSCRGKTFETPFDPPMTSYREARERVVEMDAQCIKGLGRSDVTIKEYTSPEGLGLVLYFVVLATFASFSTRSHFESGSFAAKNLPVAFVKFCWTIQPYLLFGMTGFHLVESIHMARGRLRKHSVNIRSWVWWQWMGTTFIEGVGAYMRFDAMVRKQKEAKAKQKH